MRNTNLLLKFCSLISSLFICSLIGISQNIDFHYFTGEDGLSQVSILCSIEDNKGYLWFGTTDGLNRYDGYDFTVFKTDPNNNQSIVDNLVNTLHEDSNGNIWVGTTLGISRYNYETNQFTSYQHNIGDSTSLSNNHIKDIFEDTLTGDIWIATKHGLNKFIEKEDHFERYFQSTISKSSFDDQEILTIEQDKHGRIWVGSKKKLSYIDENQLKDFVPNQGEKSPLSGQIIRLLHLDPQQRFLVATEKGLYLFDEQTGNFQLMYQTDEIRSYLSTSKNRTWIGTKEGLISFSNNHDLHFQNGINYTGKVLGSAIRTMVEDKNGIIWIGGMRGLAQYNPLISQFNTKRLFTGINEGLINNNVWSITEDDENDIIIGGDDELFKYNPTTQEVKKLVLPVPMNQQGIMSALSFKEETLWIGTWNNGLHQYNYKTNTLKTYTTIDSLSSSISSNQIQSIKFDQQNKLWIGTKKGLHRFIPEKNEFKTFRFPSPEGDNINLNSIIEIYPEEPDKLWLATVGGLVLFDSKTSEHVLYKHDKNNENSLSHNFVLTIYKAKNGTIWIGTFGGLNKWIPSTKSFKTYGVKDGLPNDVIYGILEDDEGILWISSNMGLSKFNPKEDSFTNFDIQDGLQDNEFNLKAAYKSKGGHFYFGGVNGFNSFLPDAININSTPPKIYLDRLDVLDRHHQEMEQRNIFGEKKVELSYKDYFFSIHFTALNFTNSDRNKYLYKLEGFDSNWKSAGQERVATYTNLKKGDYTFRVKAANNSGVWNEEAAELAIHICPPFWLTNWFGILMVSLLITAIIAIITIRTANIKKKNIQLEQLVSQRTADVLKQKEKIGRNEALFRSFYEKSSIGIAYSQVEDTIFLKQCNQELVKILGYSESELKQLKPAKLIHTDDHARVTKWFKKTLSDKKEFLSFKDVKFIHKNGQIVYCKCFLTFYWNKQKKLDYIISILIDETEEKLAREKLKQAETQLIQSNKMASLGQLTAGIAHEINNPVNFINSGVSSLKKNINVLLEFIARYDDLKSPTDFEQQRLIIEKQKKIIDYSLILEDIEGLIGSITNGVTRTKKIITGLQSFSREDAMKIQIADIHVGLDATLDLLNKEIKENITLEKDYDLSIGKIECFPGDLNQVFLNILINAIHSFNNQGGLIHIKTKNGNKHITIEIIDNGSGISKDISSRIFDPFFTTKEVGKGTGLGLSISYGIIQKHNGNIQVNSKLGEGTSFVISLPKFH